MRFITGALWVVGLLGNAFGQTDVQAPVALSPCTNLANAIQNMAEVQAHLQGIIFLTLRSAPANVRQAVNTIFASLEEQVTKADQIRIKSCNNEDTLDTAASSICTGLVEVQSGLDKLTGVVDSLRKTEGAQAIDFEAVDKGVGGALAEVKAAVEGFTKADVCEEAKASEEVQTD